MSSTIFTRITTLKIAHDIQIFLKKEYESNERIKGMQMLNLVRAFEIHKMKKLRDNQRIR